MTVYIDGAYLEFGRMKMCHMLADDLLELHEMAAAIGMQRRWFQPTSFPHYDVSVSKRAAAIRRGAVEVGRREIVDVMRRVRAQPWYAEWAFAVRDPTPSDPYTLLRSLPDGGEAGSR